MYGFVYLHERWKNCHIHGEMQVDIPYTEHIVYIYIYVHICMKIDIDINMSSQNRKTVKRMLPWLEASFCENLPRHVSPALSPWLVRMKLPENDTVYQLANQPQMFKPSIPHINKCSTKQFVCSIKKHHGQCHLIATLCSSLGKMVIQTSHLLITKQSPDDQVAFRLYVLTQRPTGWCR